jgi:transcriptional regulator with XRE-family HTH domain
MVAAASSSDINRRIAGRVRALRAEQGLSLEALAAKCDVSRSMLSLIERGESSPTAVVLEKIATGLGVPLASLFDDASAPAKPLSRRAERTTWRDPQSGYLRTNISPPNYPSPIQIVDVTLPAGAKVAYETGPREVAIHQQIWVQQGSLEFTLDRVKYRLEEGDCLAMRIDAPVTFRNRTRKPTRYIVVIATNRAGMGRAFA